ncbi:manganese efflux pump MntP family protein [Ruegeria sp. PrR005]|nr:manganese efflux pump MntP family protein [Ruegeria sp. PrR005]NDW47024.1 manganese efflux pump [Ruegeria sp. PrR005]
MTGFAIGLLAVTLSLDAFLASLGRGARGQSAGIGLALRTGAVFGAVEAVTPLIGWGLGVAALSHVASFDHWIAFGLLMAVGLRMALHGLKPPAPSPSAGRGTAVLLATAIGTSVDALAVGASLALLEVNIVAVALAVGISTLILSTAGVLTGKYLGQRFGGWAELLGGLVLIGLGFAILAEHLSV